MTGPLSFFPISFFSFYGFTCATGHLQVRATNTDVDDGVDLLAGVTLPFTAPHLLRELLHVLQNGVYTLDDTLAIDLHGLVGDIAERGVVDGTVLGEVDVLTLEHIIAQLFQVGFLGQLDKQSKGLFGKEVFGEVEKDVRVVDVVVESATELLEALRILLEIILQDNVATQGVMVVLESLPRTQLGGLRETRHYGGGRWGSILGGMVSNSAKWDEMGTCHDP